MKLAEGRDCRMVRCVLEGYIECPAKVPVACICNEMPRHIYEEMYKRKYGVEEDSTKGE